MPAPQTDAENCVAHNGSLIPVPGRDIMVQAWYQGGVSVFDFTDSATPVEIAFFDRGPIDAKNLIARRLLVGLLVQRPHLRLRDRARHRHLPLLPSEYLTQNEIDAATLVRIDEFNAQEQPKIVWPAAIAGGARLSRSADARARASSRARAAAVKAALDAPTASARARSAAPPRCSISSTRWRRSSRATPARRPAATRCA